MSTHAPLSPSSRYRWQLCPGSVREAARYPDSSKSSPAAIDGTHSHTLLENCVKNGHEPKQYLGLNLGDHEGNFIVNQDRIDRVTIATDYINSRVKTLGAVSTVKVISEKRVHPDKLVGRDDMSGTVDVQIIAGSYLELIDYKDGMNVVEAKDNPQLEQYGMGVLAEHMTPDGKFPFEYIATTIIQPKLAAVGKNPVSTHVYSLTEFLTKLLPMIEEANATDDPEAPLVPGEKQCKYCVHRGNCAPAAEQVLQAAGIKFENVEYVKEAAQSNPDTMTDDKLRELIEAGPLLRKMLEAAEIEALRRIQSGHPIAGLKVVRGRGTRGWSLPDEEVAAKLTRMGVPKGSVWETKLVSIAKVEKLKWNKRDGTQKQLSEKQLKVLNEEVVSMSEGKLTVVSEADDRKAVDFGDVKAMFSPSPGEPAVPAWMQ